MELLQIFFLGSIQLRVNFLDVLSWTHTSNGLFSVSSFRKCLEVNNASAHTVFEFLWQGLCPPKVEVFVWQLLRGRVLVREVLLKFGVAIQTGSASCPLCEIGSESIDHIFLLCE